MQAAPPPPRQPGHILEEDFLSRLPAGTTQGEVAERLAMSRPRLNDLLRGRRSVSLDTALRLARCFGTSPEFWLLAQLRWDLHRTGHSRAHLREIERIEPWPLRPLPREEGARDGLVDGSEEREESGAAGGLMPRPEAPGVRVAVGAEAEAEPPEGGARYYEEFLRRRGLLEEARRFARIRGQLDALEPHGAGARRPARPFRLAEHALALPPLSAREPSDAGRERRLGRRR